MSLPKAFLNSDEYFEECLMFFEEYQYLYNIANVEILIHGILDKINVNVKDIDVFDENLDLAEVNDDFLVQFFKKLKRLQVFYDNFHQVELAYNIDVPVGPKKKHEIMYLAKEIKEICKDAGCDVVVDFGSGLGYLDQLIFDTTNHKVLGIECNESHYVGAKKRQRKYHANSLDRVKYIKHTINGDSYEKIQMFLQEKFETHQKFCIVGLHACADLTIDAIDIFLKMENAKAIAIMPCCYHKMTGNNGTFKNFPLSNNLADMFRRFKGNENLKIPFLRLAAQPPNVDEKLSDLVFNLLSRALLQLYAYKHNCKLKRNRRKPVKTNNMDNVFDTYIQDAANNGFTLTNNDSLQVNEEPINPDFDIEELKTLWSNITSEEFKKAGIYIILQNHLQPVIENFVLYDRLVYLKEKGVTCCRFKKILNEKTSPRCLALIAHKNSNDVT